MKQDIEKTKRIESFLEGNMTAEEAIVFQKEMADNPELQKEVELHRDIHKVIKMNGRVRLKKDIKIDHDNYIKEINKKRIFRIIWSTVSAAASIIILFLVVQYRHSEGVTTDQVISLDSVILNKAPVYADSAKYFNSDSISINKVKENKKTD